MDYNKVIFVCSENTTRSPMAEGIFKNIIKEQNAEILSRGIVVLFDEPCNQKVIEILKKHEIFCVRHIATQLEESDVDENTLLITMTFAEKVQLIEDFNIQENVFTLKEFVEEEGEVDVKDPYGGDEQDYEECYRQITDLLYKLKRKLKWR